MSAHRLLGLPFQERGGHVVAMGTLWGTAATAMEVAVIPTADGSARSFVLLFALNALLWSVVGSCLAAAVEWAGRRLEQPLTFAAFVVVTSLVLSGLASALFRLMPGPPILTDQVLPSGADPLSSFLYQAWIVAFYGGLFALARTLHLRGQRTRVLLRQSEIARRRERVARTEVELATLRGRIDPKLLLHAMEAIEDRYTHHRAGAHSLVDQLVGFLRLAMPGVRGARHTLPVEIALARAQASLRAEIERRPSRFAFDVDARVPRIAFPPLVLGPILDALAARPGAAPVGLAVRHEGSQLALVFRACGQRGSSWLPEDLEWRLKVGIRAAYGDRAGLRFDGPDGAALTIELPLDRGAHAGAPKDITTTKRGESDESR